MPGVRLCLFEGMLVADVEIKGDHGLGTTRNPREEPLI